MYDSADIVDCAEKRRMYNYSDLSKFEFANSVLLVKLFSQQLKVVSQFNLLFTKLALFNYLCK